MSVGVLLGQRMSTQGYGQIIAMSSAAGEKVRRSNFVYGSTKAGSKASTSTSARLSNQPASGFL